MNDGALAKPGTGVVSGIKTDVLLEGEPPAFRVEWIAWSSDFRRELRINDLIVGVNGRSLEPLLKPQKTTKGVGQYAENQYWEEIGAKTGDEVALDILRDHTAMTVKGRLGSEMFYYDRAGKPALAPGGPGRLHSDFGNAWSTWYEKLVWELSYLETRGWSQRTDTRTKLAELLAHRERIDHLLKNWPGPFAETMRADWARTVELMRGRLADPPVDLGYRSLGEQRIATVKAEAKKAWAAALAETAGQRIDTFPAVSPLKRGDAVGKVVELPAVTMRNLLNDLGRAFFAYGSERDNYWFVPLERPEMQRFWAVRYRYQGRVDPRMTERFRFLGRVLDDAQMLSVSGRPAMGLAIEVLCALAGDDAMFVDLRALEPRFAGEAELTAEGSAARDDGSPASVMEGLVQAIKVGDEGTYRELFASWRVMAGRAGRPLVDLTYNRYPSALLSEWERARRQIMKDVYDVRVARVEPARRILARTPENGLPDVDQVVVWLDHYGLFDGEHRVFQAVGLNRQWTLQRLDGGPWRIVSVQSL